ncbi:MAG: NAD(P)H-hydrate dehydratase [Phycisphaerales bacterium]|nr:NAD(P)H-hydrate dehydratase [Phycisphaerales bacterium]
MAQRVTTIPPAPLRRPDAHKGDAGRVVILAGSRGMSGAAVLCGLGALRGGAGLVRVAAPASAQAAIAAAEPCLMTMALPEDADGRMLAPDVAILRELLRSADATVVGPGLGRSAALDALVADVVAAAGAPVLVDADALNSLAGTSLEPLRSRRATSSVLTPHPGEMARLLPGRSAELMRGDAGARLEAAVSLARETRAVVVLKGRGTIVTDGERHFVNPSGSSGMAAGGMGDVLAGLIAALIGRGMSPFDAACRGVWQHGAAADRAARRVGSVGYLAREVADELPRVDFG